MFVQDVTRVSLASFKERSAGKRIVLLYPWTNYRNLFLTHFLASAKEGLLYYRISSEETTVRDFVKGIATEINNVLGNFGDNARQALAAHAKLPALGEALAADLNAYNPEEKIILFIDELDRIPMDSDFTQFIDGVVGALSENVQITISSRLLTYQPWYDMVAKGVAVVLGTEFRRNDVMFTVEETPKPQLEVYALGRGYALVNGQLITNWDGALPRNLFFFFMDHPLVTRDEIFQTFWPELSVKEATNVFHVTKRKITERLSMKITDTGSYELTQYSSGFYMPSDKLVRHYDVADFQDAVERATVTTDEREEVALYMRAIDLYKAPFLQQVDMKWVGERRAELRQHYATALIGMGRIWKRRGDDQRTLGYFTRALKEAQEREDIHREVMNIYYRMGMNDDARAQYRRLEQILRETVGIPPSRETRELYALIEGG
jgi:two-component SAPR family response regulator